MPLKINNIINGSLAEKIGLQTGDLLIEINNHPVDDFLDLQYHSADRTLKIKYRSDSKLKYLTVNQDWSLPLGIEPAPHRCRACTNDCIFCFVDQMPKGMRPSLNIKDDDYRLSFVYGNFITLTNLTEKDYNKILSQHLSPLYISVHTTDPVLHKKILRYRQDFNIMEKLKLLSNNNIELHTQIVVIPGWNDGENLHRSLEDLTSPVLDVLSIGVVPIGLTKFRRSLTSLSTVSPEEARRILQMTGSFPKTFCSDEIFLLADEEIPSEEYYDEYPQLENGIGMIRLLLTNWEMNREDFLKMLSKSKLDPVFICGSLIEKYMERILTEIRAETGRNCRLQVIRNEYFGSTVTVTGLLTGKDILNQTRLGKNEIAVLSNGIFNEDELTLDNISKEEIFDKFGKRLILIDEEFSDWEFK